MGKFDRYKNASVEPIEPIKETTLVKEEPIVPKEEKISFDIWWMMNSAKIPKLHRKEVVKADFKGRKLTDMEYKSTFDEALVKYGVKL
jgi:hypothetical protein